MACYLSEVGPWAQAKLISVLAQEPCKDMQLSLGVLMPDHMQSKGDLTIWCKQVKQQDHETSMKQSVVHPNRFMKSWFVLVGDVVCLHV